MPSKITNTKSGCASKPAAKQKHPKHPKLYHNPLTLLKAYRDVRLSLQLSMEQHQHDFEQEYGMTITEYLDDIYAAGVEFTGTKLEHHANTMKRTAEMLKLVDKSVHLIKEHDDDEGESYYWILYYSFLSPQRIESVDEIIEAVQTHVPYMTRDNYFDRRNRALDMFASVLWGFTEKSGIWGMS